MRKLTFFVALFVLAGLGWGAYWMVASSKLETELKAWLEARRVDGWVATTDSLEIHGFPNRFDTTVEGLKLADPNTQVAWSAPEFRLFALSYRPNDLIAHWPGAQDFSTPDQTITVTAEPMRASMSVAPNPALTLETTTVEIKSAQFSSTKGWTAALEAGQLSMRQTPGAANPASYDLYLDLTGLTPDKDTLAGLPGAAKLPESIGAARISGVVEFDKPWDRSAIERARPQPKRIVIQTLSARWGDLDLQASGTLEIGADGEPIGQIDVKATNWREMIEIARATGALNERYVGAVTTGLEFLAGLSDDPETLDVPLGFRSGLMTLGPVPLGPAPVLRLP